MVSQYQSPALGTVCRLLGGGNQEISLDPEVIAGEITVTFRPLPVGYANRQIIEYRKRLKAKLAGTGVNVIRWNDATINARGLLRRLFVGRIAKSGLNAVIDVERRPGRITQQLIKIVENYYSRFKKDELTLLRDHIFWGGLADDYTIKHLSDTWNTQVVTLISLDPEFADSETSYIKKIRIGLRAIIDNMSELIIAIGKDRIGIINMNLSDSTFPITDFDEFVETSLMPKIYAPIKPIRIRRLNTGTYELGENGYVDQLTRLGQGIAGINLFPAGSTFTTLITRPSHRVVVSDLLDGRLGVSYGFMCVVEDAHYVGKERLTHQEWEKLAPAKGFAAEEVREYNSRYYIDLGNHRYHQVPDIWIVSSGSGADKSNLNIMAGDVVRVGLVCGDIHFQTLDGVDLTRMQIRPSFDTYVMLAQAMGAALFVPDLMNGGMPIVHFHGFVHPNFFKDGEYFTGEKNISMACGTIHAAMQNYLGLQSLNEVQSDLVCLVEPDHGVNIIAWDVEYLIDRLTEGYENGHIQLGGKYFVDLRNARN